MAEFETLVDRLFRNEHRQQNRCDPALQQTAPLDDQWHLPETAFQALARGFRGRCPSCDRSRLFAKFLKPIDQCPRCEQDWSPQQADDFPAYLSIIVTGHIMAPIIISFVKYSNLPIWGDMAIILPLAIILMIFLLQPAKGAVIAFQWWMGMHGFKRPVRTSLANAPKDKY